MEKFKTILLMGLMVLVMTACPVKVETDPPEKVEKGITDEMRKRNYELTFDVDGKSFKFNDSQPILDALILKDTTYMPQWWARTFGDYKGPLVSGYGMGDTRRIDAGRINNSSKDIFSGFILEYDNRKGQFVISIGLMYIGGDTVYNVCPVESDKLNIDFENEDVYIRYSGSLELIKNTGKVKSKVKLTNLFLKGKLFDRSPGNFNLSFRWGHSAHGSSTFYKGVSRVQDFTFIFTRTFKLTQSNLDKFLKGKNAIEENVKMDTAVNYLYLNGQKVFGSWNADGTVFTYTPATPYPANSKIDLILPEDMRDLDGNRLYMPFHHLFETGDSNLGMPNLDTPFNGEYFGSVDLRWDHADPYAIAEHMVERAENPSGPFITIAASLVPDSYDQEYGHFSYQDINAVAGKSYYYRVTAKGKNGVNTVSKVVEGHALKIEPAQLGQAVISNYQYDMTRTTCYSFKVIKGKQYRYEVKDQTNSKDYSGLARLEIMYKKADGSFAYHFAPAGSVWQNRTDTITASSNEIYFIITNENSIFMPGETNNLSFTLTEVVTPAAQ